MFKTFVSSLFPNTCISCNTIIDNTEFVCDYCYSMLETQGDDVCEKCGVLKSRCDCKKYKLNFDAVCASYYNSTIAKKAMYAFKFGRNIAVASFFAQKMALTVKQKYYGLDFDYITAIPMNFSSKRKRGFNQSEILAKLIGDILDIEYRADLLYCRRKKRPQHKTPYDKRFINVKDIYKSDADLKGLKILLVDDIKTSGATLSEASKVLKKAGAAKVYCIAGVIGRKEKKL